MDAMLGVGTRVGHAYAEYANDADYAHMRNMRMRMRIENLIHIIHIWIFAKNGNFLGQKWVSLALFSILSAQNIIIGQLRLNVVWEKCA